MPSRKKNPLFRFFVHGKKWLQYFDIGLNFFNGIQFFNIRKTFMGVPIFKSKYITADYFLVSDFNASTLWTRENAVLRMWDQNSTDPEYDLITFTLNGRYALETPNPNTYAHIYGDFTSAITAIDNTGQ